jgi:hypothetical protein
MLCEHNQQTLIEAAAAGDPLPLDVRSHVDACPACHAALEREQLLFASIDNEIRKSANAEVPQSLIPTLRVRLGQEPSLRSAPGVAATWGYAAAAAVLLLALVPFGLRQFRAPKPVYERTAQPAVPKSDLTSRQDFVPTSPAISARSQVHKKNAPPVRSVHESESPIGLGKPEVLVPPNQELLLARYADALRKRSLILDASAESKTVPLGSPIELIEVAELEVSPLAALESE